MGLYAAKRMKKRLDRLNAEFRKGPKYPYWPGLSVVYAYAKAGYFDWGKMEEEAKK
jgi:polyferredoxin